MRLIEKLPEMAPSDELINLVLKVATLLRIVAVILMETIVF